MTIKEMALGPALDLAESAKARQRLAEEHQRRWQQTRSTPLGRCLSDSNLKGKGQLVLSEEGLFWQGSLHGAGDLPAEAMQFAPWRKGPFRINEFFLDSEWKSHWKWARCEAALGSLRGKILGDVGCNNGFFLFSAALQGAEQVIGFDPFARPFCQFQWLQQLFQCQQATMGLWGFQELEWFCGVFDVLLCLGVLYHHQDPLGLLKRHFRALRRGGILLLETLTVAGDETTCLFVEHRYAGMGNCWFLPSVAMTQQWLRRVGFEEVRWLSSVVTTPEEQRRTAFAEGPSLAERLHPEHPTRTIEGLPAPERSLFMAKKPHSKNPSLCHSESP
jgi:tRNA (mo5U34)-methyltransferase